MTQLLSQCCPPCTPKIKRPSHRPPCRTDDMQLSATGYSHILTSLSLHSCRLDGA